MASYSKKDYSATDFKRLNEIELLLTNKSLTKEEREKLEEEREYIHYTMQPMYGGSKSKSRRKMRKSKMRKSKRRNTTNKK
jgi:hypothetical protein